MKYLMTTGVTLFILQLVCYAVVLTGCTDDQSQVTLIKDARFTVSVLPLVRTPAGCDDITPVLVRDVKTGAEYLLIATAHGGLAMTRLDSVPANTAEKAP